MRPFLIIFANLFLINFDNFFQWGGEENKSIFLGHFGHLEPFFGLKMAILGQKSAFLESLTIYNEPEGHMTAQNDNLNEADKIVFFEKKIGSFLVFLTIFLG